MEGERKRPTTGEERERGGAETGQGEKAGLVSCPFSSSPLFRHPHEVACSVSRVFEFRSLEKVKRRERPMSEHPD